MRLSDLLDADADVVDVDGVSVGRVRDTRLVQDGPIQGTFGAGLRLTGLIVGPLDIGSRLGFRRAGVHAPAIVARPVAWLDRRTLYVPWDAVAHVRGRTVSLDCTIDALAPPAPVNDPAGAP